MKIIKRKHIKEEEPLSPEEAREWLFRFLSRRSCTRQEALERLKQQGLDEDETEPLLDEAQEMSLLDDEAYARLFARGHRSWGNDRVAYELRRRGVDDEHIQAALEEIDEEERALPLVEAWKRIGLEARKIAARLHRRGFTSSTIRAVCEEEEDSLW